MTEETNAEWISGFWRRIGAFVIDSIILGIVGLGLGLFLAAQFAQLGGWGRAVGFIIALSYFGILNSKVFGGQTIGKRLVEIRVVNSENQTIDLIHSLARYAILGIPFFLNGARFTDDAMTSFWLYPISLVIFGGVLSVAYLYLFNRVTRQSLHDLALGTFVVNAGVRRNDVEPIWRPHLIVVGVLFLVSALLPVFTSSLAQKTPFEALVSARAALSEFPSVTYVGVSSGTTTRTSTSDGTKTMTYLSARVFLDNPSVSDAILAEQLATSLASSHPGSQQIDVIQIVLTYGYDIGIASSWRNHSHAFKPIDLIEEI